MAQEKVRVTQQGYDELKREQEHLIHTVRKEVIEDLQAARAQGDLSENADYDAARDRQARVEARIREIGKYRSTTSRSLMSKVVPVSLNLVHKFTISQS